MHGDSQHAGTLINLLRNIQWRTRPRVGVVHIRVRLPRRSFACVTLLLAPKILCTRGKVTRRNLERANICTSSKCPRVRMIALSRCRCVTLPRVHKTFLVYQSVFPPVSPRYSARSLQMRFSHLSTCKGAVAGRFSPSPSRSPGFVRPSIHPTPPRCRRVHPVARKHNREAEGTAKLEQPYTTLS